MIYKLVLFFFIRDFGKSAFNYLLFQKFKITLIIIFSYIFSYL